MRSPLKAKSTLTGPHRKALLVGVAVGALYGVLLRGYIIIEAAISRHLALLKPDDAESVFHYQHLASNTTSASAVMTIAFLGISPTIIGYLTATRMERTQRMSVIEWLFGSWLAILVMMAIVALFAWEGAICVVMALPLALFFASLGGLAGGLVTRYGRQTKASTACLALAPFVLAPAETLLPAINQTRTVHNEILIHASPDIVWRNIERVPAITRSELRPNWTHRIGFPRPVEATLSYEGLGGIRHASFERGLLFIETVDTWEPDHRLGFSIHADSAHIPTTTLDEHVTIGGRYFDVLHGEYRLEPLSNGDTRLHLASQQRLSTDFNGYAGFWTDAVMSSLQNSILQVIQHRCEHTSQAALTAH